jgi:hypothetical protein
VCTRENRAEEGEGLLSPERAATTEVAVSDPTCHSVSTTRIHVPVAAPTWLPPVAHAGPLPLLPRWGHASPLDRGVRLGYLADE